MKWRGGRSAHVAPLLAGLAVLGILAVALGPAVAAGATHPVSPRLRNAVERGDRALAGRIEASVHTPGAVVRLIKEGFNFKLSDMASTATHCRDSAFAQHRIALATLCNSRALFAARMLGDLRLLLKSSAWAVKLNAPDAPAYAQGSITANDLHVPVVVFTAAARAAPSLTVEASDKRTVEDTLVGSSRTAGASTPQNGGGSPASQRQRSSPQAVRVYAAIDGHKVVVDLDTGSTGIQMDASTATRLGLEHVRLGQAYAQGPAFRVVGKSLIRPQWYLASSFKLGNLVFRNMLVGVVPDNYDTQILVGINVMARFGQITFGHSHVIFDSEATPCESPVQLTWQQGGFTFPARSDGLAIKGWIDTGNVNLLTALRRLAKGGVPTAADPALASAGITSLRYLSVTFSRHGKYSIQSATTPVFTDAGGYGPDFVIGTPILARYRLRLRFAERRPSICFLPRKSGSARLR